MKISDTATNIIETITSYTTIPNTDSIPTDAQVFLDALYGINMLLTVSIIAVVFALGLAVHVMSK